MQPNLLNSLLRLAVKTLHEPKSSIRTLLKFNITIAELSQITLLVVTFGTLYSLLLFYVQPIALNNAFLFLYENPILLFAVHLAAFLFTAFIATYVGRIFNGKATYKEVLLALNWLQIVLFGISVIQQIFFIFLPSAAPIVSVLVLLLTIHVMINFIMEIHGFTKIMLVILAFIATFFAVAFFFSILLLFLGISPEAIKNV